MAEEYGVFATSPTATETAAARLFRRFAPSGVVPPDGDVDGIDGGDGLAVTADGTSEVTVGTGYCIAGGYWYRNTTNLRKPIIPNSTGLARIDRLVIRADPANDQCVLAWLEGTPGSSSPPEPTRTTDDVWEEVLCRVTVEAGATSAAQGSVQMERRFTSAAGALLDLDSQGTSGLAPGTLITRDKKVLVVLADGTELVVRDGAYPTTWTPLSLASGVTSYRNLSGGLGYTAAYRYWDADTVELRGAVARSNGQPFQPNNLTLGTVPSGARPTSFVHQPVAASQDSSVGQNSVRLEVQPDGEIRAWFPNGYEPYWVSLEGFRYPRK